MTTRIIELARETDVKRSKNKLKQSEAKKTSNSITIMKSIGDATTAATVTAIATVTTTIDHLALSPKPTNKQYSTFGAVLHGNN